MLRTGLDWTQKYPGAATALANLRAKTAYLDGELCGVDAAGLPSFAQTQAASDGERGVTLIYYSFDLLRSSGRVEFSMSRVAKRSAPQAVKTSTSRRGAHRAEGAA